MSCSVRSVSPSRTIVSVNGRQIPRDVIAREAQHHPSDKPTGAWEAAARALVIRELLLQEANRLVLSAEPLVDDDGRRETDEEASMRTLIEQEVQTPVPDEAACQRYFEQNRQRFRTPNLFEASHILLAAHPRDAERMRKAEELASAIIAELRSDPGRFPDLAALHSDCPSASQGGNLGQLGRGRPSPSSRGLSQRSGPGTSRPNRSGPGSGCTSSVWSGGSTAGICRSKPCTSGSPLICPRPSRGALLHNMSGSSPGAPRSPAFSWLPQQARSSNRRARCN